MTLFLAGPLSKTGATSTRHSARTWWSRKTLAYTEVAAISHEQQTAPYRLACGRTEMLVDACSPQLCYRRLRRLDSRHWLQSAIRGTAAPFAATVILLMITCWAFSIYTEEAPTIAEVFASR